jgi:hypothetical protein
MNRCEFVQRHLAVMERFEDMDRWDEFSPFAIERMFAQDEALQRYGTGPHMLAGWKFDLVTGTWHCPMRDGEFAAYLQALRECVKLPLSDGFLWAVRDTLARAEKERRRRLKDRERARASTSDWQSADLLAEVQAVAGEGQRRGREHWFRCPWHRDNDASLEVNPEKRQWHCFGCDAKGGVVDWRKRAEQHGSSLAGGGV